MEKLTPFAMEPAAEINLRGGQGRLERRRVIDETVRGFNRRRDAKPIQDGGGDLTKKIMAARAPPSPGNEKLQQFDEAKPA
jgi:hypothetical protein